MTGMQGWSRSTAGGGRSRSRPRSGAALGRSGRWVHLIGAIALIVGLFLPLTDAGRALANPATFENPALARAQQPDVSTTAFTQVTAVGDFQAQLGCGVFDVFCPSTQLTNHDGLWTGSFAIPPASYQWQIIAQTQDGQQFAFVSNGPSTQPDSLNLADTDVGAFFSFDAASQEAEATALPAVVTLSTDAGTYAMSPDNGNYTAIIQAPQDGQVFGEAQINGAPSGVALGIPVEEGPNRVTIDPTGSLLEAQSLGDASLTISRIDGSTGQPIAGGCYELTSNGQIVSRACDTDDGLADGSITLTFPTGFAPGSFTLSEVSAPDGAEAADDQDVDLQYGDNFVQITTGDATTEEEATEEGGIEILPGDETQTPEGDEPTEDATETPADEAAIPGDLIVTLVDASGAPIGGACFQLERDGEVIAEECDIDDNFPFNGNTGFFGVPSGTYTLHQSTAPDGTEAAPDQEVTVPAGGEQTVTVTAPASAEPTPEATGQIVVLRQDTSGNPVGGACFELIGQDGNPVGEPVCDEDGDLPDDGRIGFFDVPAGTYTLRETRMPEGFDAAPDTTVDVTADGVAEVQIQSAAQVVDIATEEPTATTEPTPEATATEEATETPTVEATEEAAPGSLIITLQDANGQPIGGACFELRQGETVLGPICDSDDPFPANGNTGFFGVPSGTYQLHQTTVPEGTQPVPVQDVEVPANAEDIIIVQAPASEATEEPTSEAGIPAGTGSVVVDLTGVDQSSGPICVELNTTGGIGLLEAPSACDNGEGDSDPTAGIIRLDGVTPGSYALFVIQGPAELTGADPLPVTVEDGVETQLPLTLPTPEPTPTLEPTATLEPTPEPTATPEPGTIEIRFEGETGEPVAAEGACITIDGVVTGLCDNTEGDASADAGVITVSNVPEGTYAGTIDQAPSGYEVPDPSLEAEVAPATTSTVGVTVDVATTSFTVSTVDASGTPLPNACYLLDDTTEPICDDDDDGVVTFEDIVPGDHSVTPSLAPIGYELPAAQTVTVAADGTTTLPFQVAAQTGSVQITTVDAAGEPVTGVCYSVDDSEPVCDDGVTNVVTIEGLTVGDHTIAQTTTPAGYITPASQTVAVTADGPVAVSFQNIAQTGSIRAGIVDEEGTRIAGACISIDSAAPVCDNDATDTNREDGFIDVAGVALGDHSVAVTSVPEGFDLPDQPQTATVEADALSTVAFTLVRTAPTTGGLDVTVQFDDEAVIEGVCVIVTNTADNSVVGPICDGEEGDTNEEVGVIGFEDLPAGTWLAALADGTEIEGGDVANTVPQSVDVQAGTRPATTLTVPRIPTTGSIRIVTTDGSATIPGAGYTLTQVDELAAAVQPGVESDVALAQAGTSITVVDNDGTDVDGTEGVIQVDGLEPGTWLVSMTTTPEGYSTPADTEVAVEAGAVSGVEIAVEAVAEPGSLLVRTTNTSEENLPGACYAVEQGGVRITLACDGDDAVDDGVTTFASLDAGTYQLVQTTSPGREYAAASPQTVEIVAGEETTVVIEMEQRPGRLTILTVDDADRSVRLNNACYQLEGATTFGPFCDADDGTVDGRVIFTNVPAGEYTLVQNVAPSGFEPVADRTVTITAGGSLQITVANTAIPEPEAVGQLVVIPLSPNGAEVAGGCYQVFDGDRAVTDRICDNADDIPMRIIFNDLPVGEYTVVEHLAPSPDYIIADPMTVTIREGERTDLRVEHEFKPGRLLVRAVNTTGQPLANACFTLNGNGVEPLCTDANGEVLFTDLMWGTRNLTQTEAPIGYRLDEAPREVSINPGQTTVVQVVFESEPLPNTGTVQVKKFICPAGEDGERTMFLGGAQGNAQLQQTANCTPGAAEFTLEPENGSENNSRAFATTAEGRAQVTVEEGIYVLTETNPDLPGSSSARLRVGVGQMTTVIVINFVAPPEPAPATINVAAFTCPPSFNGTTYGDFATSCANDAARTNQITIRAEGESRFKQVTGDQGQLGTTTFAEIPAGSYEIYAEKPYSVPLMYTFCGSNADNPSDYKVINGAVSTELINGETINCEVFLVPEQLTAETGAILVQKFSCPIDSPVKGYDFQGECSRSEEQITFEIAVFNAEMQEFEPLVQVTANPDGIVRFPNLRPGTYKLTEVGAKWCFAQSNSVNADGDVIVQANKLSEVWVYNCVGTQEPPNTGSGDAAGLPTSTAWEPGLIGPDVAAPPDIRTAE